MLFLATTRMELSLNRATPDYAREEGLSAIAVTILVSVIAPLLTVLGCPSICTARGGDKKELFLAIKPHCSIRSAESASVRSGGNTLCCSCVATS